MFNILREKTLKPRQRLTKIQYPKLLPLSKNQRKKKKKNVQKKLITKYRTEPNRNNTVPPGYPNLVVLVRIEDAIPSFTGLGNTSTINHPGLDLITTEIKFLRGNNHIAKL